MTPLRRHQLVRLNERGWARVVASMRGTAAQGCITHWAEQCWPLVVTRQTSADHWREGLLCLGLPAPSEWGRARIALTAERSDIAYFDEFPEASAATRLLPRKERPGWEKLFKALSNGKFRPRVYGSYGWQLLTGQQHVRPGSDLDLLLTVSTPDEADRCATLLSAHAAASQGVRLDGELMFANGAALPWREWFNWRSGLVSSVIVKTTLCAQLTHDAFWEHGQNHSATGCFG